MLAETANQQHLDILAKGVETWNAWRGDNCAIRPSLRGAALSGVNLIGAKLYWADLTRADLTRADLRSSDLSGANLTYANLSRADLSRANLSQANLNGTSLIEADVSHANLHDANLTSTCVNNANFKGAVVSYTNFCGRRFPHSERLASIHHSGPSTIGLDTIHRSGGQILEAFLRGAGVPQNFIKFIKSLPAETLDFFSVFISYSTKDQVFADRLHADLQAKGVRCWFAPHDIQGGRKIHDQIDEAIKVYDKLLLILSDASMNSNWVKTEIANARAKEEQQKRQMLFPITMVPYDRIRSWKLPDAHTGIDSAREIREYFVPDFSNWKDHDSYTKAFGRLVGI